MRGELKCPICGEILDNLKCPSEDCSFSERYTILREDTSLDEAIAQLGAMGAYINVGLQTLVIPGRTIDSVYPLDGERAAILASFLRTTLGMTQRNMQANHALTLCHRMRNEDVGLPRVEKSGDYPLMDRVDGRLVYLGHAIHKGYYYQGPRLTPQDHGGVFEKWIDSFRWASRQDRQLLRAWLLTLFAQRYVPPGRYPALLLGTHSGSSVGKTETANMISKIFGRMISRYWSPSVAKEADREMVSGEHRFFCADNLVADKSGVISGGHLSEFITRESFETKRLYSTGGTVRVEKPTVDILTANYPLLALDLLQRVVAVGLRSRPVVGNGDWIGTWEAQRSEILEEGLWIVQENSKKFGGASDCTCGYADFRYPLWYSLAVECAGEEFTPFPENGCVGCPLDIVLERLDTENEPFQDIYQQIKSASGTAANLFKRQVGEFSEEKICGIIARWSKDFKVVEKDGVKWIQTL
jgi:hypothetical protein